MITALTNIKKAYFYSFNQSSQKILKSQAQSISDDSQSLKDAEDKNKFFLIITALSGLLVSGLAVFFNIKGHDAVYKVHRGALKKVLVNEGVNVSANEKTFEKFCKESWENSSPKDFIKHIQNELNFFSLGLKMTLSKLTGQNKSKPEPTYSENPTITNETAKALNDFGWVAQRQENRLFRIIVKAEKELGRVWNEYLRTTETEQTREKLEKTLQAS